MTRCHVCERPCVREVQPACGEQPAVTSPDVWTVAMRNGLHVPACLACWMKWPDGHKVFPDVGFGRTDEPRTPLSMDALVDLLGGAA